MATLPAPPSAPLRRSYPPAARPGPAPHLAAIADLHTTHLYPLTLLSYLSPQKLHALVALERGRPRPTLPPARPPPPYNPAHDLQRTVRFVAARTASPRAALADVALSEFVCMARRAVDVQIEGWGWRGDGGRDERAKAVGGRFPRAWGRALDWDTGLMASEVSGEGGDDDMLQPPPPMERKASVWREGDVPGAPDAPDAPGSPGREVFERDEVEVVALEEAVAAGRRVVLPGSTEDVMLGERERRRHEIKRREGRKRAERIDQIRRRDESDWWREKRERDDWERRNMLQMMSLTQTAPGGPVFWEEAPPPLMAQPPPVPWRPPPGYVWRGGGGGGLDLSRTGPRGSL